MIALHPTWMYRGEESRLFYEGQEIPNDWYDAPSKFNGADPKAFDHDGDGRAGGAKSFSIEGEWEAEPPMGTTKVDANPIGSWRRADNETVAVAQPKRRGRPPKVRPDAV